MLAYSIYKVRKPRIDEVRAVYPRAHYPINFTYSLSPSTDQVEFVGSQEPAIPIARGYHPIEKEGKSTIGAVKIINRIH